MRRIVFFVLISVLIYGCKKDGDKTSDPENQVQTLFTFQGLPKTVTLSTKANEIASKWQEYQEFRRNYDVMFNAVTNEDLELAIVNLLENETKLSAGSFPTEYDHMKIKGRLKVNRTFLLKVKADLENRKDATASLKQFVEANNALQKQLNLMVNNPINLDSIFNEG